MLIQTKLKYGSILLTLIPAVFASFLIGKISVNHAEKALKEQTRSRLVALREDRSNQISNYFNTMRDQALVFNKSVMTIEAMQGLYNAFENFRSDVDVNLDQERKELSGYYKNDFSNEYQNSNNGEKPNVDQLLARLDDKAIAMQYRYIFKNSNPLGSKDLLESYADGSRYAELHNRYHLSFRALQRQFGYYDIFLISPDSGHVVYSVFKETDYATSLKNGPFADSGLAEAYRGAMALSSSDEVFMTDYAPYLPSYQAAAVFMATPIIVDNKKIGVIAFQLPIDRINSVMTGNRRWVESGLGESGESYLVGSDNKLRSESRFWLEHPDDYISALAGTGVADDVLKKIEAKGSGVGVQSVRSPGVSAGLKGDSGFDLFDDYRGIPVLSAYKPLDIFGHRWVILAEEDEAEAYLAANNLNEYVIYLVLGFAVIFIIISGTVGWLFSSSIIRPLNSIVDSMQDISSGAGDLTVRLNEKSKDEIGQLASAFNIFVTKLDSIMSSVGGTTKDLALASDELAKVTSDTKNIVDQQQNDIEHVATAIEEMTATVKEVAQNTNMAADASRHAGTQVDSGRIKLQDTADAIQKLKSRMEESKTVVSALNEDSVKVGSVLDVIKGVSEQTNLLALNAAIEAARAGEQGRGFAVVADEVRVLAKRTQDSTEEIREIINALQNRSTQTSHMLEQNNEDIELTVQASMDTQTVFSEIEKSVQELLDMSSQVACATEEQASVTEEIGRNVERINQGAKLTLSGADQTANSSVSLADLGDKLKSYVGRFKCSG